MKYEIENQILKVTLDQHLHLKVRRAIEYLSSNIPAVHLDMSRTIIVDSEGIILLDYLIRKGKSVHILNPPQIFYKVLNVLSAEYLLEHINIE